ncbi:pilus assembly protein [Shewanella intestini]|uniref:rRNA (Guanine-N1)-methyltransferase n=1 Tax=Shewanella intestini TaxID=2017544 RepID=A0ABS5I688_9GAMM|nr:MULTISPECIES: PilC/PilY family type IV pilus protein [Shewanella]MBR9729534.1 rRNA (guanine-N1)-methyltransferase [Shewanella intestini]MRG37525.1 rRNA (guanine-N1)-methyltransferase [Shewanella sp. XMDDZSB0408]
MIKRLLMSTIGFFSVGYSAFNMADDTELYVTESSIRTNERPQVLIIFDTSGSMEYVGTIGNNNFRKVVFESDELYSQDSESLNDSSVLYYSNDIEVVPDINSSQTIEHRYNGCAQSADYLTRYGMFTGYIRHYDHDKRDWVEMPINDGQAIDTIDCFEDISEQDQGNARGQQQDLQYPDGFPVDGYDSPYLSPGSKQSDIDDAISKAKNTDFGLGNAVTLYTKKYVQWYHSNKKTIDYTRMDVARRVIEDTIMHTPGVDFGLAIFNKDDQVKNNGGRIIHAIQPFTDTNKKSLLDKVQNLHGVYRNYTPLCDTLFEAYRYFSGGEVHFGNNPVEPKSLPRPNGYEADTGDINPLRDMDAESNGRYISPFVGKICQSNASIVYITDGEPTRDNYSNSLIEQLVGHDVSNAKGLPTLAKWMYENDVNPNVDNTQNVTTYTIGFSSGADNAAALLQETANNGGGSYFHANSADALQKALQKVFAEVNNKPATFSSPAVSSGRMDTDDSAYQSMFLPSKGPRWSGNIKKLTVSDNGELLDASGRAAIDESGLLKASACSLWTTNCTSMTGGGDGSNVQLGGVAQHLQSNQARHLLSNLGVNGGLQTLTKNNAQYALGGEEQLAQLMGANTDQLNDLFSWIQGYDVNDDNDNNVTNELRQDIMGDPLHSSPLVINYGTQANPNIKIFVGTNHGFMHMFTDRGSSVAESWAFMPQSLLANVKELTDNQQSGVHSVYGIDSSPVAHIKRSATGAVERAWLFFGMRRGGNAYYALDITNPDVPVFKWRISAASPHYSEMGQTWSEPVITYIPGYPANNTSIDNAKPVMIVGAGYSPATKDSGAIGIDDTLGKGVYIIDADTGELVHHFGRDSGTGKTPLTGITDSIPNKVAILDSDSDGLTDRIYATDTGANIWRMDLPSAQPNGKDAPWTGYKLASLGGQSQFNDRRFFNAPEIAQTMISNLHSITDNNQTYYSYHNVPYDAVVVGSGHRPHPLDKIRQDKFFVVQDRNVVTRSFNGSLHAVPKTLEMDDLYNVTSAPPTSQNDEILFATKRGWYFDLPKVGEKSLSSALIAKGRVFFTSYVPGDLTDAEQCFTTGVGLLYGFDLHRGTRSYKELSYETGEGIPNSPTIVVPKNGDNMYIIGIGIAGDKLEKDGDFDDGCADGDERCIGGGLQMNRIYFHHPN